jgi:hypothetical protein
MEKRGKSGRLAAVQQDAGSKKKATRVRDRLGKHRGCARRRQARKTDDY